MASFTYIVPSYFNLSSAVSVKASDNVRYLWLEYSPWLFLIVSVIFNQVQAAGDFLEIYYSENIIV